jgi:hypothetical protein
MFLFVTWVGVPLWFSTPRLRLGIISFLRRALMRLAFLRPRRGLTSWGVKLCLRLGQTNRITIGMLLRPRLQGAGPGRDIRIENDPLGETNLLDLVLLRKIQILERIATLSLCPTPGREKGVDPGILLKILLRIPLMKS